VNPGGGDLSWVAIMLVLLKDFDGFFNCLAHRYILILKDLFVSGQPYTVCYGNNDLNAILGGVS
jgi:hypothetical protein